MSKKGILALSVLFVCVAVAVWFIRGSFGEHSEHSVRIAYESTDAPKAIGPYSQAVFAGNMIFLSGQIGLDPVTGKLVEGGIETETEQVMKNLGAVLKASNSDFDRVVKSTIFLADINDFPKVNEIYGRYFTAPFPARSTVQVARLPRDAKVEVEVIAMVRK